VDSNSQVIVGLGTLELELELLLDGSELLLGSSPGNSELLLLPPGVTGVSELEEGSEDGDDGLGCVKYTGPSSSSLLLQAKKKSGNAARIATKANERLNCFIPASYLGISLFVINIYFFVKKMTKKLKKE
jgi:hypothetical protein